MVDLSKRDSMTEAEEAQAAAALAQIAAVNVAMHHQAANAERAFDSFTEAA